MTTLRTTRFARANFVLEKPFTSINLEAQERHLRRKLLVLEDGTELLVDFEKTAKLEDGDCFVLDDGRLVQIAAQEEDLLEVRGANQTHLAKLAWHIGNRHLEAQIERHRILIRLDHVIAKMLEGQGAMVKPVREKFSPENGAYAHAH
ncbi:urease accessory protein UreE [Aestuariivirga litoralis]|uniref:urease accessory protein UreE n=1 Tax=Aestuariivirga litoralis TaxID=2650924 RepID=UPI0018C48557|nr:urease accessory protein UreE [Aestuariivirga litoralis]MBG1232914.1 urease accessory protein UreE [Aestuariivirga litoralis]